MVRAVVIERGKTAATRRVLRRGLGTLRDLQLAPATLKRYQQALKNFWQWLATCYPQDFQSVEKMVQLTATYIEYLWDAGEGRAAAGDILSALQFRIPLLKNRLTDCWRLLTVWSRVELPTRTVPLPEVVLDAFVQQCMLHNKWRLGAAFHVAFHALLRASEVVTLRVGDVAPQRNGASVVLTLRESKSGHRFGRVETVLVDRRSTVFLLVAAVRNRLPEQSLFEVTYLQLHAGLAWCAKAFHLQRLYIRTHSLRRGGATCYFQMGLTLSQLCVKGRWSQTRTARQYIDQALAESCMAELSASELAALHQAQRQWLARLPASLRMHGGECRR
eukprot:4194179-Amphidinium_carterae.1